MAKRKWREPAQGPRELPEIDGETDLAVENRRPRELRQSVTGPRDILNKTRGVLSKTSSRGAPPRRKPRRAGL